MERRMFLKGVGVVAAGMLAGCGSKPAPKKTPTKVPAGTKVDEAAKTATDAAKTATDTAADAAKTATDAAKTATEKAPAPAPAPAPAK